MQNTNPAPFTVSVRNDPEEPAVAKERRLCAPTGKKAAPSYVHGCHNKLKWLKCKSLHWTFWFKNKKEN